MPRPPVRAAVRALEHAPAEEQWTLLCYLAGRSVPVDDRELNAAVRRAELLLAAGGDPHRPLELYGRAVTALAEDLDEPGLRAALASGLELLAPDVQGLRGAGEALRMLLRDPDLAWQCFALAVLADELASEGEDG